jgi:Helix-turn-helix domain
VNIDERTVCRPAQCGGERPLLVHHVARLIRRKRRTVRHLAQTGRLHGFKLGVGRKIWAFRRSEVERFLGVRDEH